MLTKLINGQKKLDYTNIGAVSKKKNMKTRYLIRGMNIPKMTNFDTFHFLMEETKQETSEKGFN